MVIAIIVLIVIWYTTEAPPPVLADTPPPHESDSIDFHEYPTIHAHCSSADVCGGDLVCDIASRRCKKMEGGDCAQDVDCAKGLQCVEWHCRTIEI